MRINHLTKIDVLNVASSISITLTDEEVDMVMEEMKTYEDPTATWDLMVEDVIYNVIDQR